MTVLSTYPRSLRAVQPKPVHAGPGTLHSIREPNAVKAPRSSADGRRGLSLRYVRAMHHSKQCSAARTIGHHSIKVAATWWPT